jgi:hypothetical protein
MEDKMILDVARFGEVLSSRPQGREAALVTLAYIGKDEKLFEIDFAGVLVMTPSWLSEFVQTLKEKGISQIKFLESVNPSVISSIEMIQDEII